MHSQKFMDKATVAFCMTAAEPTQESGRRAVFLLRAAAVRVIDEYAQIVEKRRYIDRLMRKNPPPEGSNITILNPFAMREDEMYKKIIFLGEMLFHTLDFWQNTGATLEELQTLCNGGGEYWYNVINLKQSLNGR